MLVLEKRPLWSLWLTMIYSDNRKWSSKIDPIDCGIFKFCPRLGSRCSDSRFRGSSNDRGRQGTSRRTCSAGAGSLVELTVCNSKLRLWLSIIYFLTVLTRLRIICDRWMNKKIQSSDLSHSTGFIHRSVSLEDISDQKVFLPPPTSQESGFHWSVRKTRNRIIEERYVVDLLQKNVWLGECVVCNCRGQCKPRRFSLSRLKFGVSWHEVL